MRSGLEGELTTRPHGTLTLEEFANEMPGTGDKWRAHSEFVLCWRAFRPM